MADAPYRDVFNYTGTGSPGLTATNSLIQSLIDQGIISQSTRNFDNENGPGSLTTNNVDFSRLPAYQPPTTNLPGGRSWVPAYGKLINPNLTYNDPNYGLMTVSGNSAADQGDWQNFIGPALMAAVTLGAGSLASAGVGGAGAGLWGTGAGLGAEELGAGAGAAGAGFSGGLSAMTSLPWYASAGLNLAKSVGGSMLGADNVSAAGAAGAAVPKATSATMLPAEFNPALFGSSFGSPAATSDGSERVATAVAPDAYGMSQTNPNQVVV